MISFIFPSSFKKQIDWGFYAIYPFSSKKCIIFLLIIFKNKTITNQLGLLKEQNKENSKFDWDRLNRRINEIEVL